MSGEPLGAESFERVYRTIYPILIRVSYHITGNMAAAEDLCQEAFIRYYQRDAEFPSIDQAKYWLIRVVKNLAFNHEKRKGREKKAHERILKEPQRETESGETEVIKKETYDIVKSALHKLPYKLRTVLVLREYGGLNYKEIAGILKITEGNVKVRVFRAREQLSKLIDEEEVYVS
jgi:RNA polymerase sigma-70 factor, ECF subfamily